MPIAAGILSGQSRDNPAYQRIYASAAKVCAWPLCTFAPYRGLRTIENSVVPFNPLQREVIMAKIISARTAVVISISLIFQSFGMYTDDLKRPSCCSPRKRICYESASPGSPRVECLLLLLATSGLNSPRAKEQFFHTASPTHTDRTHSRRSSLSHSSEAGTNSQHSPSAYSTGSGVSDFYTELPASHSCGQLGSNYSIEEDEEPIHRRKIRVPCRNSLAWRRAKTDKIERPESPVCILSDGEE